MIKLLPKSRWRYPPFSSHVRSFSPEGFLKIPWVILVFFWLDVGCCGHSLGPLWSIVSPFLVYFWFLFGHPVLGIPPPFLGRTRDRGVLCMQLFPLRGLDFYDVSYIVCTLLGSISIGGCRGLLKNDCRDPLLGTQLQLMGSPDPSW